MRSGEGRPATTTWYGTAELIIALRAAYADAGLDFG